MKSKILLFYCLACLGVTTPLIGGSTPPAAAASNKEAKKNEVRVEAVFAHWVKALGGAERLKKLDTIEIEARLDNPPHFSGLSFHSVEALDGRFHYDLVGADTVAGGYDGKRAWHRSAGLGFGYVPQKEFHTWVWRSDALLALSIRREFSQITFIQERSLGKNRCAELSMAGPDTNPENWFFDLKSGFLVRIEQSAGAKEIASTVNFSDFRKVSGVEVPFHIEVVTAYQTTAVQRLNVTVGHSIDDDFGPAPVDLRAAATTDQILDHYLLSIGGKDVLGRVHSRITQSTVETFPMGISSHVTISEKEPNLLLREEESPGMGKTFTGFDGKVGWINSEIQGFRRLKETDLQQWRHSTKLEAELDVASQYPLRKYVGSRYIDGHPVQVMFMSTPDAPGGTFYFDEDKGFLVRVETEVNLTPKNRVAATVDFGDYRVVDGLSVPFKTTWTTPTTKMVMTYQSIAFNPPLPDDVFKERRDD